MHRIFVTAILIPLFFPVYSAAESEESVLSMRIQSFNRSLPDGHPRLLITRKDIVPLRAYVESLKKDKEGAVLYKKIALEPGKVPVKGEPEIIPGKKMSGNADTARIWQEGYTLANNSGNSALRLAFMYVITGEDRYARESAKWLIHLSSWDVDGAISIKINDEAFIQSLRPMIFSYDWIFDALTPGERSIIEKALRLRLDILWKHITPKFSLISPTLPSNSLSHPMRFISTLGQGGLALYKESPGADKFLAWTYEYYNRQFPVWGGDDGGWAEGLDYWGTGMSQHLRFLEGMQILGFSDPLKRPFFKNNGYFGAYNMMPYPFSSFGDLTNITRPNANRALVVEKYALMLKDPYLHAFSRILATSLPSGFSYYEFNAIDTLLHGYRLGAAKLKEGKLSEIPQSRVFRDIGWAVMHSTLGDKDNDIMMGLKSSPFGSASHSFSDQNSFVINAFGEPLAISSGYREWYDSPHHAGWTRTTASKNAVLIDGKGQPVKDAAASGVISRFYAGSRYDYATGDARQAYRGIASAALRHVMFVNKRFFVILDEIDADKPSAFQWLLHSREKMIIDEKAAKIVSEKGSSSLSAYMIKPSASDVEISQTGDYAVPIDKAYRTKFQSEWHTTVSTKNKSEKGVFFTLLYPEKKDKKSLTALTPVAAAKGYAVRTAESATETLVVFGGKDLLSSGADFSLKGLAASLCREDGSIKSFFVCESTGFDAGDFAFKADNPVTCEGFFGAKGFSLRLDSSQRIVLEVKIPFTPKNAEGIPLSAISYNAAVKTAVFRIPAGVSVVTVSDGRKK